MSQFFPGLKSRTDEARLKAARNLQKFVSTELRELPAERYSTVLDEINQNIFALVSSPELHEKKGGVLAIGKSADSATKWSLLCACSYHGGGFLVPHSIDTNFMHSRAGQTSGWA